MCVWTIIGPHIESQVSDCDNCRRLQDLLNRLNEKPHGHSGYTRGCRCDQCKEAKHKYMKSYDRYKAKRRVKSV